MEAQIFQYVFDGIVALGLLWIGLRKLGSERASLNGAASESYATAAKIVADDKIELEKRIAALEHKKYRVMVEFEIGDPPSVGVVTVEPICVTPSKKKHKKTIE
jgi:hypothetical protein